MKTKEQEQEQKPTEELTEIKQPPKEAAQAVLSEGSQITVKELEISEEELFGEFIRRLSVIMPVIKKCSKNELIRILANTMAPPWLVTLGHYELKNNKEKQICAHIGTVIDAQIAMIEMRAKSIEVEGESNE